MKLSRRSRSRWCSRIAPLLGAGRGLKPAAFGLTVTGSYRPAPRSGARIETATAASTAVRRPIAPLLGAGRGLKHWHGHLRNGRLEIAPLLGAGRGLKRQHRSAQPLRNVIAPLLGAGRGLKHSRNTKSPASAHRPAPRSGARIETCTGWTGVGLVAIAPLLGAGRGLKHPSPARPRPPCPSPRSSERGAD